MPQAVNLVVKNGATTPVDKTFTLMTPAAGDGGLAIWALKEGTIASVFPQFTASATSNARGRKLKLKLRLPSSFSDAVTGLTQVGSRAEMNVDINVPDDFPETLKDDFVAFCTNLANHALVKSMMRDAYPAT